MGREHIFSAQAQVPTETDISQRHKFVCIIVTVDIDSGEIIDCHVPMYCDIQNTFVKKILAGKSLSDDKEVIIRDIDERMHTPSKRALISAVQGVYNHFILTRKMIMSGHKRMSVQQTGA
jgi:hypothetical protein